MKKKNVFLGILRAESITNRGFSTITYSNIAYWSIHTIANKSQPNQYSIPGRPNHPKPKMVEVDTCPIIHPPPLLHRCEY